MGKNHWAFKNRWALSFITICVFSIYALFRGVFPYTDVNPNIATTLDGISGSDTAWILTSTCLVLIMTPGLSFFYGGMIQKKNIISTMLQSFICLGIVTLLWIFVAFSLSFGDPIGFEIDGQFYSVIGNPLTFSFFHNVGQFPHKALGSTIPFLLFAVFQMKFAVITPAIITGSFAGRVRFISYLLFITLFTVILYPPLCHAIWYPSGILGSYFGIKDFAGGTVVHMSAGFAALAGVIIMGKRKNFEHNPSNITYVLLGTGLLWFGWFGFNAGSALGANGLASHAFVTTSVASASAMLTWIFFDKIRGRKVSALGACIGAVVGLVAITPAAGYVSVPISVFIGYVSALVSNVMVYWKTMKKIDDTLDVFACHGVGGLSGMIMTAIFAEGENASLLHGGFSVFSHHMIALVIVAVYCFFGAYILYKVTNFIFPLRVGEENEQIGLDISQHGESIN